MPDMMTAGFRRMAPILKIMRRRLLDAPIGLSSLVRLKSKRFYQRAAETASGPYFKLDFMNWGYVDLAGDSPPLGVVQCSELQRLSIRLYHFIATAVEVADKEILEVACGRGAGAYYIMKCLAPKRIVGIDNSKNNIRLCRERHRIKGLTFELGDAEDLPFDENSFDVVLNVESGHCFGSLGRFLREAHRVLRPGGFVLFADMFQTREPVDGYFERAGMRVVRTDDITPNVLRAREQARGPLLELTKDASQEAKTEFLEWVAVPGSRDFERIRSGQIDYRVIVAVAE